MKQPFSKTGRGWILISLIITAISAGGCKTTKRTSHDQSYLLQLRKEASQLGSAEMRQLFVRLLERTKSEYDDYAAGRRADAPIIDILIISGGGDWGAFGAGFLKGWGKIPKSDPMAQPEFDAVT